MISDREMDDFDAALLHAGFEVHDFNVIDLEDEPIDIEQYFLTSTVTIHRISTDISETYTVGFDLIWPQQFEADLQAGKFGEP